MNMTSQCNGPDGRIRRRSFIKVIGATGAATFLQGVLYATDSAPDQTAGTGLLSRSDEGELLLIGPRRAPVRIKMGLRNGSSRLAMGTEDIAPGDRIPVHKHGREDEIIFIHSGEGMLTLGDDTISVKTGDSALVPIGTWHGLENTGTGLLTMVWIFSPAGFEQYFRDIGVKPGDTPLNLTNEEWHKVDGKHAITYKQ
jgi:quercetin dioxygenase-like cupin family protein